VHNIKLTLEYDGTGYHGWQRQAGEQPTVQQQVEDRLRMLANERVTLIGAGRTDAGVHALGQAANFRTRSRLTAAEFQRALNGLLPPDIVIVAAEELAESFHARFDAKGKRYEYRILNRELPAAVGRQYAWHLSAPLSLVRMRRCCHLLKGRHDFSAFQSTGSPVQSPVRYMTGCGVKRQGDLVTLWFEANGFLRKMARALAATLIEVGAGKLSPEEFGAVLESRDRARAAATAPACGLFLTQVLY
jgi:tRNA pseudouridine38-40 synthase